MTRTALWAPTVLIATFAVVASPAAAKPRQSSTSTQEQCEKGATDCLAGCASIDTTTKVGQTIYNRCVPKCDRQRNSCLLFSTRK
jgi:hypothetical protein